MAEDNEYGDGLRILPLHVILLCPNKTIPIYDIVEYLLATDQSTINITAGRAWRGESPLHMACSNKMLEPIVIKLLHELQPGYTYVQNGRGMLPLHCLCEEGDYYDYNTKSNPVHTLEIVELILNSNVGALRQMDNWGNLPIHYAVANQTFDCCKLFLELYPESISIRSRIPTEDEFDEYRLDALPFYIACGKGFLDVVEYLYDKYPESINQRNREGMLPIHNAASQGTYNDSGVEIIKFLLSKDPDGPMKTVSDPGMSTIDKGLGQLPLHMSCWGCEYGYGVEVTKILFNAYPEAILVKDHEGRFPIDVANSRKARGSSRFEHTKQDIVIDFLETQQEYVIKAKDCKALGTIDKRGRVPLFHALQNNGALGSIKMLVKMNPSSVRVTDDEGVYPLQVACEFSTLDVVQYLVEQYGRCLSVSDDKWNSPLHYACRGGNVAVVKYLLDLKKDLVTARNIDKELPFHLFCISSATDNVNGRSDEDDIETIWSLLLASPEIVTNW